MKLDYQQIMELPEPLAGADVATLDLNCSVYLHLVGKFTRLLREARRVKMCWMQQERVDLYAKRLAANQHEYRQKVRQMRQGEMTNFRLRVREWVLGCAVRRSKIRGLIGEARITKWLENKLARIEGREQNGEALAFPTSTPDHVLEENLSIDVNQHRQNEDNPNPYKRGEVRDWFRLPTLPRRAKSSCPKRTHVATCLPAYGGMRRAVPSVVFWPHELADDYVSGPNPLKEMPKKISKSHARKGEVLPCAESQYLQEYVGDGPTQIALNHPQFLHAAKEWPD